MRFRNLGMDELSADQARVYADIVGGPRKANAADSAMQPHIAAIDTAFAVIGANIGGLLAGSDAGTKAQPIYQG